MPWLADTDVGAAYGLARRIVEARTEAELRGRALQALAELVPAEVLTWDRAGRGGRPRLGARQARVLRARPRRARHRSPRARGRAANHSGPWPPRPCARRRSAAGDRRRAAQPRRRDRALES